MFKKLFEFLNVNVGTVCKRVNKEGVEYLAVFNPLVGFDEAELNELCRQCGVEANLSDRKGYDPVLFIAKGVALEDFESFLS